MLEQASEHISSAKLHQIRAISLEHGEVSTVGICNISKGIVQALPQERISLGEAAQAQPLCPRRRSEMEWYYKNVYSVGLVAAGKKLDEWMIEHGVNWGVVEHHRLAYHKYRKMSNESNSKEAPLHCPH